MQRRHRVVIIGCGFGGLSAARALKAAPVDVLIVDANNFHTFQPLLYQVATAGLDVENIAYSVRGIVRRARNTSFRQARVTGIDLDDRTISVDRGAPIDYDTLILAAGTVAHDFGIDGVTEHARTLKSPEDALAIRARLLDSFERAMQHHDLVDDGALNIVIAGGGPTGVELAGGMIELYAHVLERDFPDLPVRQGRVVLVEMADRLLTPFSPESSERARQTLARRGVEVRLGVGVDRVEATRVHLDDGTTVPAYTTVWAAGVAANPLAETLGVELGKAGRVVVDEDLTIPGHREAFVVGDLAAATDGDGELLPQVAQPAIQAGRHVAEQIRRRVSGLDTEPFEYSSKGQMATIGRYDAVTELPSGRSINGPLGWVAWLALHLMYLIGFRNRANVLVNWAWNYLTYDRGSRLLAESQRPSVPADDDTGSGNDGHADDTSAR